MNNPIGLVACLVAALSPACGGGAGSGDGGLGDGGAPALDLSPLAHDGAVDFAQRHSDDASHTDGPVHCAAFCAGCQPDEDCFASSYTTATCLKHCSTTSDCPKEFHCAELIIDAADVGQKGPPYQTSARLCFSATLRLPAVCGMFAPDTHCDLVEAATCSDAATLRQPVSAPGTCGWEYVACAGSCDPGQPDGGPLAGATCR